MTLAQLRSLRRKKIKELDEVDNLITQTEAKKLLPKQMKKLGKCYHVGHEFYRVTSVEKETGGMFVLYFRTYEGTLLDYNVNFYKIYPDESFDFFDDKTEIPYEEWADHLDGVMSSLYKYTRERVN